MTSSALIFGAGNVGRGFIGQLFSESGYEVVFVDVDQPLLDALNRRGSYTIRLVDNDRVEEATVGPVRALHASQVDAVAAVLAEATIGATAVGVRALPYVAPVVAAGIARRAAGGVDTPLNLIICENLKDAAVALRSMVLSHLPAELHSYCAAHIGFVDTVIGRMAPPLTPELRSRDPSLIIVEPYKELPVDRQGFLGPPSSAGGATATASRPIVGMELCDNFPAYTARKLYIHNCGHAVLAYLGHLAGYEYGYEALADPAIRQQFDQALAESKAGIVAAHQVDAAWLDTHLADLTRRFANRALGDTILRLGRDPVRKLGPTDRLVGAARLAEQAGVVPHALSRAIAAGYRFDDPRDALATALQDRIAAEGLDAVLAAVSGIQPPEPLTALVRQHYYTES
jgi:mannitol-1-phosphate 5-dehydrogenase